MVVTVVTVVAAAPAAPAEASDSPVTVVAAGGTGAFHLDLAAGAVAERTAVVTNRGSVPLDVALYAADATTTVHRGLALAPKDALATGVGAWTRAASDHLLLPPHGSAAVPVGVAVPPEAAPGDYAGGVVVDAGRGTRRGIPAHIRVLGEARARMQPGALQWERTSGGIQFHLPITNTGKVPLVPTATVHVGGVNVGQAAIPMRTVAAINPGASAVATALWRHPPRFGEGRATAVVSWGSGRMAKVTSGLRLLPGTALVTIVLVAVTGLVTAVALGRMLVSTGTGRRQMAGAYVDPYRGGLEEDLPFRPRHRAKVVGYLLVLAVVLPMCVGVVSLVASSVSSTAGGVNGFLQ
jgi:hypothetical protein